MYWQHPLANCLLAAKPSVTNQDILQRSHSFTCLQIQVAEADFPIKFFAESRQSQRLPLRDGLRFFAAERRLFCFRGTGPSGCVACSSHLRAGGSTSGLMISCTRSW